MQLNEETKRLLILHDPHDLVEENPVGQPGVSLSSALEKRVHLHVLAVELDAALSLHHVLKQHDLQGHQGGNGRTILCLQSKSLNWEVNEDHKGSRK